MLRMTIVTRRPKKRSLSMIVVNTLPQSNGWLLARLKLVLRRWGGSYMLKKCFSCFVCFFRGLQIQQASVPVVPATPVATPARAPDASVVVKAAETTPLEPAVGKSEVKVEMASAEVRFSRLIVCMASLI